MTPPPPQIWKLPCHGWYYMYETLIILDKNVIITNEVNFKINRLNVQLIQRNSHIVE